MFLDLYLFNGDLGDLADVGVGTAEEDGIRLSFVCRGCRLVLEFEEELWSLGLITDVGGEECLFPLFGTSEAGEVSGEAGSAVVPFGIVSLIFRFVFWIDSSSRASKCD